MFNSIRLALRTTDRADHGRSGEGTASMLAHLQRQNVRPATPDLGVTAWADTCPGSFDRLWAQERQHSPADEYFPPTMTMGLSEL